MAILNVLEIKKSNLKTRIITFCFYNVVALQKNSYFQYTSTICKNLHKTFITRLSVNFEDYF